ncbi:hypothetical protein [Sphingosinicella sp.]|uniref:hypothetical protein n=1 Tax=Sphingosinicella sp. TaxID=1917971 RepID=UPI0040384769
MRSARAIPVLHLATLAALLGCSARDYPAELNAANAQLQAQQAALDEAERNLNALRARVDELEARGDPIHDLRLSVTVRCRALSVRPPERFRAGTVLELIQAGGGHWRMSDDPTSVATVAELGTDLYAVTFTYQARPGEPQTVLGQDVRDLTQVSALRVRLDSVLAAFGLEIMPDGNAGVSVAVNGLTLVDVQNVGAPSTPDQNRSRSLDVSSHFSSVPDTYRARMRQAHRGQIVR